MTNETDITMRPDLTSEAKTLIERARAEGNTQLLKQMQSAEALLPSSVDVTNTQVPSDITE